MKKIICLAAAGAIALFSNLHATARAAEKPLLSLRAFAIDMGSPGRASTGTIDIVIERWSTDADRARLKDVLVERGSDKLLSTLQDMKPRAGYIRSNGGLGWDIRYAREETSTVTGSRRIVIATDRPMSYWETVAQPRSSDYEFTLGEIRIGADGKGEGKLVPAAKVSFNKETQVIEIENYATEPVRLTTVTAADPKKD